MSDPGAASATAPSIPPLHPHPPRRPLPVPRTSDLVLGLLGGLGGMLLGLLVGAVPALLWRVEELVVLGVVLSAVGGVGGLWLALGRRAGWSLADVGFRSSRRHHAHLLWEVPLLFVANVVLTLVLAAPLGLLDGATPETSSDPTLGLGGGVRWWLVLPATLMIGVVLPLVEEVVFRRLLLDWLGARMPTLLAALVVVLVFGLVHVAPPAILYVGGLGICLVLLRLWHQTLWAPLALHAANNLLVCAIAVGVALG